ncbi:MAG: hypothetical protein GX648_10065 [Crenarchaeota archaeon]|nr:hypothetical protein [Thermoproteota archaeon]
MNWKNVLYLLRVERKSGRLIRGIKKTRYKEYGVLAYWPYWVAAIIGVIGGLGAKFIADIVYSDISQTPELPPLSDVSVGFFVTLPTLILIVSIVFSMLQQIQLSGVKKSTQVMYWLPITWQEQTLASVLANLLGFPSAIAIGFAGGLIAYGASTGLILQALLTALAIFGAAFMGSSTTEILRVLQSRFIGAVYKSSGRAAVGVRFVGSILFFVVFYVIYFFITQGFTTFIQGLTTFQSTFWFIPFVWVGLSLFYIFNVLFLEGILFVGLSALFIVGLYLLAVFLNQRFGLYEPPAIRVQKSGDYTPKTGILGKLGVSTIVSALIRKDLRSFTRRRELMGIFIVPIVFVLLPVMQSVGIVNQGAPSEVNFMFLVMTFLFPCSIMSMSLGNMLIGEEGEAVWRIFVSPITAKNLVKSKYFFIVFFGIVTLLVTNIIGNLIYQPSTALMIVGFLEGLFLIFALGSIALSIGFKGADFSVSHRPRMIRPTWSYISLAACGIAALGVLSPLLPFAFTLITSPGPISLNIPINDLAIPVVISAVIAVVITIVFYRINVKMAQDLITKAEI